MLAWSCSGVTTSRTSTSSPSSISPDPGPERLVIATRESRLALWQAEHVQGRLSALYPRCRVELLPMSAFATWIASGLHARFWTFAVDRSLGSSVSES